MSEQAPERPAPSRGSGGKLGLFKERIGPLPMWVWVAIIAAVLIAWRLYADKKNASAASTTATGDGSVGADQVPEFINQTYTTVTPPVAQAPPAANPVPTPVPRTPTPAKTLTRTWISQGGSTYAEVAQRLIGSSDVSGLKPANAAAQKWVSTVYAKNHNAKMPKGLYFSYTEGTVTNKAAAR